ncbi:EutP/PduV family microcompartment system protein [Streptococcus sp. 10F2]
MKKIMLIGPIGVGKTSLTQRLHGLDLAYQKTQVVQFHEDIIDTPGEFLQHRQYYHALNVTAMQADVIGLMLDASKEEQFFPQGFSNLFTKEMVGLITKMDLIEEGQSMDWAYCQLQEAGCQRIFELSAVDNRGLSDLLEFLQED